MILRTPTAPPPAQTACMNRAEDKVLTTFVLVLMDRAAEAYTYVH
jgi:hypothetical protein